VNEPSASTIKQILEYPLGSLKWTLQGFGMLRAYLSEDEVWRLHIWDQDMAVEDVSTVHDHPWDLDSRIVSGTLRNQRFERVHPVDASGEDLYITDKLWNAVLIRTGEGGHPLEQPDQWWLRPQDLETYMPSDTYHQDAPEIHESIPVPGTVTIVRRTFSRKRDIATSLYRDTPEWVSAEPRPATDAEVLHFTRLALARWDA
jgi:hypothetical protein